MSETNARSALMTAVAGVLGNTPTQWENKVLDPKPAGKWAQVNYVPAPRTIATMGESGEDYLAGFVQVLFRYPNDKGWSASDTDFEAFRTAFKAAKWKVTSSGQEVTIANCSRNAGFISGNWWAVPITISWYAFISR